MANTRYTKAKIAEKQGAFNLPADTLMVVMINTASYTVNVTGHEFLSDVPGGARIGTPVTLSGVTVAAAGQQAAVDANDVLFAPVPGGPNAGAFIIYKSTGVEATSRLLAYLDTGTNIPAPTPGGVELIWSNLADKIFSS